MDLISLLLADSKLKIVDERAGVTRFTKLDVLTVSIISPAITSDQPMAATPIQALGSFEKNVVTNINSSKIIMPAVMSVRGIVSDKSTAESLINAWKDQELTFKITSRNILVSGMALVDLEFKQDNVNISSIGVELSFEQTVESITSRFDPKQSADRDQLGVTTKSPTSLTDTVANLYNSVTSTIGL